MYFNDNIQRSRKFMSFNKTKDQNSIQLKFYSVCACRRRRRRHCLKGHPLQVRHKQG